MKKLSTLFIALFLASQIVVAQEDAKFSVTVSMDSVLYGNYFQVVFSLKNAKGQDFQAPAFGDFFVKSGPNMSSSFSMMNGEVSQSVSYTFYLEPKDIGNYYIQPASIAVGEMVLETEPVEILVVPNPEGVIQQQPEEERMSEFFKGFGRDRMPGFQDFQLDFGDPNLKGLPKDKDSSTKPGEKEKDKKKKKKRKIYKI
ncbi:MAG: BatD family protein [Saprospiraceae bacterium]|nr:BatD family protein [Saprospiraceae bacterium]